MKSLINVLLKPVSRFFIRKEVGRVTLFSGGLVVLSKDSRIKRLKQRTMYMVWSHNWDGTMDVIDENGIVLYGRQAHNFESVLNLPVHIGLDKPQVTKENLKERLSKFSKERILDNNLCLRQYKAITGKSFK